MTTLVRFACEAVAECDEYAVSIPAETRGAVFAAAGAWAAALRAASDAPTGREQPPRRRPGRPPPPPPSSSPSRASARRPRPGRARLPSPTRSRAPPRAQSVRTTPRPASPRPRRSSPPSRPRPPRARRPGWPPPRRRRGRARASVRARRSVSSPSPRRTRARVVGRARGGPAAWMRLREDVASDAGWAGRRAPPGAALVAAHVDACRAALEAATARDAPPPDKRLLGATLAEAVGLCVRAFEEVGEGAEDEDGDADEGDEDTGSGSDSDSDSDSDSEDPAARAAALVEGETEAEMLERYAEVARELAASAAARARTRTGGGRGWLGDVDDAFDGVLEGASNKPTKYGRRLGARRGEALRRVGEAVARRGPPARLVALVDAAHGAVRRSRRAGRAREERRRRVREGVERARARAPLLSSTRARTDFKRFMSTLLVREFIDPFGAALSRGERDRAERSPERARSTVLFRVREAVRRSFPRERSPLPSRPPRAAGSSPRRVAASRRARSAPCCASPAGCSAA